MMKKFIALFLLLSAPALAAESPIDISAAKSLIWNRSARTYTANEKVLVKQGTSEIRCDKLVAHYADDGGMTRITQLEAEGNVVIVSKPYTGHAQRAVYDVDSGTAQLSGGRPEITSTDGNSIAAERIAGSFAKDMAGLKKVTAKGNIMIRTPKETVTGDDGAYDIPTQKAVLTGRVTIKQGDSWLEGTRADVDMATGISQLSGNTASDDGRVRGVFYPKKATTTP